MLLDFLIGLCLVTYLTASAWLFLYGINAYVMIGLHLSGRHRRLGEEQAISRRFAARPAGAELPLVTTQLPIYNERFVIERLLRAVCAFDYPQALHEIQVLDDSDDETVAIIAALVTELRAAGHDVHHIRRADRRGYKAGALADGLRSARGEYVAVFDADFVPPPDFLLRTVPFLLEDPACGFVQTRWGHRNAQYSLLTELQSIGIDGHFVVEQTGRAWNGLFCNFNGTAGLWRVAAIEAAGGWKADTLTEDLDLSYRSILAGWQPRYLLDTVTPAEIPTDINALKSQQHRWAKGSIQTAVKLLPQVLRNPDLSWFQKLQAAVHLTHYMIHPLILVMTFLILPLLHFLELRFPNLYSGPLVVLMLLALLGPSTLYCAAQLLKGGDWRRTVLLLPALIALGIGLAVNNSRAVWEALRSQQGGEFIRTPKLGLLAEEVPIAGAAVLAAQAGGVTVAVTGGTPETTTLVAVSADRKVPGSASGYRRPLSRLFLGEIFMGVWALAASLSYLFTAHSPGGALLLVQAVGFTCVGVISVLHYRGAEKLGC